MRIKNISIYPLYKLIRQGFLNRFEHRCRRISAQVTGIWIAALTAPGFSLDEAAVIINSDDKNSQSVEKQLRNVRISIRKTG